MENEMKLIDEAYLALSKLEDLLEQIKSCNVEFNATLEDIILTSQTYKK